MLLSFLRRKQSSSAFSISVLICNLTPVTDLQKDAPVRDESWQTPNSLHATVTEHAQKAVCDVKGAALCVLQYHSFVSPLLSQAWCSVPVCAHASVRTFGINFVHTGDSSVNAYLRLSTRRDDAVAATASKAMELNILRPGFDGYILQPVYAHTSVADVKHALTKLILARPSQMLLYYNGLPLVKDTAMLAEYGISSGASLSLVITIF